MSIIVSKLKKLFLMRFEKVSPFSFANLFVFPFVCFLFLWWLHDPPSYRSPAPGTQYLHAFLLSTSFPNTQSSLKLSNAQELLIIPTTNFHESFIIPQVCYYIIWPFVWSTWIHNADRVIFLKHTFIVKKISKNCISHTPFVRVQAHHDVDTIRFLSIFSHSSFLCSFCFE